MRGSTPPAMKEGQGPGPQTTPPEEGGEEPLRDPTPLLPPPPPLRPAGCRRRASEALTLYPRVGQGSSPLPLKGPQHPGGNTAKPVGHAPPPRHPPCSHRDRDRQADPRQHTRAPN